MAAAASRVKSGRNRTRRSHGRPLERLLPAYMGLLRDALLGGTANCMMVVCTPVTRDARASG